MQTPDFYIPFDSNNNLRSPIMTPEIMAFKLKPFLNSANKNKEEETKEKDELCVSIYKEEQSCRKKSSPQIKYESKSPQSHKKYFSSSNLIYKGNKEILFKRKNDRNFSENI